MYAFFILSSFFFVCQFFLIFFLFFSFANLVLSLSNDLDMEMDLQALGTKLKGLSGEIFNLDILIVATRSDRVEHRQVLIRRGLKSKRILATSTSQKGVMVRRIFHEHHSGHDSLCLNHLLKMFVSFENNGRNKEVKKKRRKKKRKRRIGMVKVTLPYPLAISLMLKQRQGF